MTPPRRLVQAFDVWPVSEPYLMAFDRLSDGREYTATMTGAAPRRISYTALDAYARTHEVGADFEMFEDIIWQLDSAYLEHIAAKMQHVTKEPSPRGDTES